jgi:hypothetical protein
MARNLRSDHMRLRRLWGRRSPPVIEWRDGRRADGRPATVLRLLDTIPRPPFVTGARAITITSEAHRLNRRFFGAAGAQVNAVGARGHGRTLTALWRDEPLAAISYHLDADRGAPLLITAIAVLSPSPSISPSHVGLSEAMAIVLLAYLSRAAVARGAPERLGLVAPLNRLPLRMGFVATAPPPAYAQALGSYLEWRP